MNIAFPPFVGFFRELIIFVRVVKIDNFFILLGFFVLIVTSVYSVILMVYLISGLEVKFEFNSELRIGEHLNLFLHRFFLFIFILGF